MHEPDSHPVDNHFGGASTDFGKPLTNQALVGLLNSWHFQVRKIGADCVKNKLSQPFLIAPSCEDLKIAEGFDVELLYSVPGETMGSWVCLTPDAKGRLIVSDQYGKVILFGDDNMFGCGDLSQFYKNLCDATGQPMEFGDEEP